MKVAKVQGRQVKGGAGEIKREISRPGGKGRGGKWSLAEPPVLDGRISCLAGGWRWRERQEATSVQGRERGSCGMILVSTKKPPGPSTSSEMSGGKGPGNDIQGE